MSLKINSLYSPIHRTMPNFPRPVNTDIYSPFQKPNVRQINYEELDFIIETLKAIAEEKSQKHMGFLPTPVDKEEIKLAKKANELANMLLDNPRPENIKAAKKFVKRIRIIEFLEVIAKERDSAIGFHSKVNEGDIKLARKATQLASNLKIPMSDDNTYSALEFISLVELIKKVEFIAYEKGKGVLGFHKESQDEEDVTVEKVALQIANALKMNPDQNIVQAALEFIQIVEAHDKFELREEMREQEDELEMAMAA